MPLERSLAGEGWLPLRAGKYVVVVTWCPLAADINAAQPSTVNPQSLRHYAIARAKAAIEITDGLQP